MRIEEATINITKLARQLRAFRQRGLGNEAMNKQDHITDYSFLDLTGRKLASLTSEMIPIKFFNGCVEEMEQAIVFL